MPLCGIRSVSPDDAGSGTLRGVEELRKTSRMQFGETFAHNPRTSFMSVAQLDVALDRPLPQNPEAERAVLGSILTNPHNFYQIVTIVRAEDFFKDANRTIFTAITALAEKGVDIDTLTLKHELAKRGALDQA